MGGRGEGGGGGMERRGERRKRVRNRGQVLPTVRGYSVHSRAVLLRVYPALSSPGNRLGLVLREGRGGGFEKSTDCRGRRRNFRTDPVGGVGCACVTGPLGIGGGCLEEGGEGGGGLGKFRSGKTGGPPPVDEGGGEVGGGGMGGTEEGGGGGEVGGGGISRRGGRILRGGLIVGGGGRTSSAMGEGTLWAGRGGLDDGGLDMGGAGWEDFRFGGGGGVDDMAVSLVVACKIDESRVGTGGGVGEFFSTCR